MPAPAAARRPWRCVFQGSAQGRWRSTKEIQSRKACGVSSLLHFTRPAHPPGANTSPTKTTTNTFQIPHFTTNFADHSARNETYSTITAGLGTELHRLAVSAHS